MNNTHLDSASNDAPFDVIGIGIGPFNLSLAALASRIDGLRCLFLDQRPGFDWHPGLMIEGCHLQTPFLSDLVTLADPTHPLSFLNYLKQRGRIYSFYIRENFFLLRQEYNQYCQWAASQLESLRWHQRVDTVQYDETRQLYAVTYCDTRSGSRDTVLARKLVLGVGTEPKVPDHCQEILVQHPGAIHSADYLNSKDSLQQQRSITVVGSGQSAAEIFHDLLQGIDSHQYRLNWITGSARYYPLEYTKLTLEMTSPEYVDYFHGLPGPMRQDLLQKQKGLYKGINSDLINEIYNLLYTKRLMLEQQGRTLPVTLTTNSRLMNSRLEGKRIALEFWQHEQGRAFDLHTDSLILCTGYRHRDPACLQPVQSRLRRTADGNFDTRRNYSIDHAGNEIFLQNADLPTHGISSPDLGMACYRNAIILREITGVEHYPVESRIAFQTFDVSGWGGGDIPAASEPSSNEAMPA